MARIHPACFSGKGFCDARLLRMLNDMCDHCIYFRRNYRAHWYVIFLYYESIGISTYISKKIKERYYAFKTSLRILLRNHWRQWLEAVWHSGYRAWILPLNSARSVQWHWYAYKWFIPFIKTTPIHQFPPNIYLHTFSSSSNNVCIAPTSKHTHVSHNIVKWSFSKTAWCTTHVSNTQLENDTLSHNDFVLASLILKGEFHDLSCPGAPINTSVFFA